MVSFHYEVYTCSHLCITLDQLDIGRNTINPVTRTFQFVVVFFVHVHTYRIVDTN